MAGTRTLGPVPKAKGGSTGIGLEMEVGKNQKHVRVAYVEDSSPFYGALAADDEILEVNGQAVTHPKKASELIVAAEPDVTLLVQTPSQMIAIMGMGKK